ncbi:NAD(P)/FAD-dependent oxidoreductase [Phaeacidiphilus oryzae]|uniref:NAD(P)/FAD-dependent oxidoreductase n=1 Tax=Phaeacidiphilus oryzae TaxID=348818 RepID=UPI000AA61E65|nr:NAD(P)/FAD-dependent oxidoreductase [Phaeacidiphilus oryzae]
MPEREQLSAGTLIVGAGQAGLQLAVSLRQFGDTEPIVLVGDEPHPPYQRPPLSKEFLAGRVDRAALALRGPEFYRDQDITLVTGAAVEDLALDEPGRSGAGSARLAGGGTVRFRRLALATGAAARRLDRLPGAGLDGVCYLRGQDEAAELRSRLSGARRIAVVGGGFIGLEAAAIARAAGCEAVVLEAADRLLGRAVGPRLSAFFLAAHRRRGTEVRLSAPVAGFTEGEGGDGRVTGVRLADGTAVPADLVLIGAGALPRTELAERLGLECRGGILVDESSRTSNPGVVAAGDCTVRRAAGGEGAGIRLESVQNAVAQAQAAAAALLGRAPGPPRSRPPGSGPSRAT